MNTVAHDDIWQQLAERLCSEGLRLLPDAALESQLRPVPCDRTLQRAACSGELEALKNGHRWVTSEAAVRRWVARRQQARLIGAEAIR